MNKKEFTFLSSNGTTDIKAYIFFPDGEYKAIVQICHGMSEHFLRYGEFIDFLTQNGFVVCGNDHLGHGASHSGIMGYMGHKDGHIHMVNDMHILRTKMERELPKFPYFMLGHSMGSFLLRSYVTQWGGGLAGILLSGTGDMDVLGRLANSLGLFICKTAIWFKGPKKPGKLIEAISYRSFANHFAPMRTKSDWQSRDETMVDQFIHDELCGFPFTYEAYRDLLVLIKSVSGPTWAALVPKALPIFLFSGADDPVGNYSRGVLKVWVDLNDAGVRTPDIKIYDGGRHEMLNETNRWEVYEDVLAWLEGQLEI